MVLSNFVDVIHGKREWSQLRKIQNSSFHMASSAMLQEAVILVTHDLSVLHYFLSATLPLSLNIVCVGMGFTQDLNCWVSARGLDYSGQEQSKTWCNLYLYCVWGRSSNEGI